MKRWTLYALAATGIGATLTLVPFDAHSQSAGSFVALQATTPGTAQSGNVTITGRAQVGGFRLTTTPTAGYVLTSDATGVGTWQMLPGGGGGLTLPFAATQSNALNLFSITNSGTGAALFGRHSTSGNNGTVGSSIAGVSGSGGIGVLGAGATGVRGESAAGTGTYGLNTGTGNNGSLGTTFFGATGTFAPNGNNGSLGNAAAGVSGTNLPTGNNGHLGTGAEGSIGVHNATGNNGRLGSAVAGASGVFVPTGNSGNLGTALEGALGTHAGTGNNARLGTAAEGAVGTHAASGNNGRIGTAAEGVRGTNLGSAAVGLLASATEGVRGTFPGGNFGIIANATYGVRGESAGGHWGSLGSATNGTQGVNANGNFGLMGNPTYGTYGGQAANVFYGGLGTPSSGAFGASLATGNFGLFGDPMYGGYGFSTVAGGAGLWGNSSATVGVLGTTDSDFHGVDGQNMSSFMMGASGVRGFGNGASGPGMPSAAALRIDNGGVTVAGPIMTRPMGTIAVPGPWIPIYSCPGGCLDCIHVHIIGYYTDLVLLNDLIIPGPPNVGSIITATVESDPGPPPGCTASYVQVFAKMPGTVSFRVARMGDEGACRPPSELLYVHYNIINPLPPGAAMRASNRAAIRKALASPKPISSLSK